MITTAQHSVGLTATKLVSTSQTWKTVTVHVHDNGDIYLGNSSSLTHSTGLLIDKGTGPFTFEIGAGDEVWAISETTTILVTTMVVTL